MPELRFPGFTDPWEQRKLGDVANRVTDSCDDPELPRISYEDIISDEGTLNKPEYELGHEKAGLGFERGDVLYGKLRPYLHNWLLPQFTGVALGDFWVLRPKGIDPEFLYRLVQSAPFEKVANVSAGSKMPRADWKLVSSSFFAFPPSIIEQCAIGCFLRDIDDLITLHQHEHDRIKLMKASLLQRMFPKIGSDVPELRFPGFTDSWMQCKLGDLASSFDYGLNAAAMPYNGKVKYIRITDIDDGTREFSQNNLMSPDASDDQIDACLLNEGDILFARTGASVGKTYRYRIEDGVTAFAGFLIRAVPKACTDSRFLFQSTLTDGYKRYIDITSQRSGQPGVNAAEYAQWSLMVPSLPEQQAIGSLFSSLDSLIILRQREIEALKNLKTAFLQKMFV